MIDQVNFLARYLFLFLAATLPFSYRTIVYGFTPGFHEYETAFLYVTDFLVLALVILVFFLHHLEKEKRYFKDVLKIFIPFLGIALVTTFFSELPGLSFYLLARLVMAIILAVTISYILKLGVVKVREIFFSFGLAGIIQTVIGFWQFKKQHSLGLNFLGESFFNTDTPGVAKFIEGSSQLVRAYGTLPHPNILAAFLGVAFLSMAFFYINMPQERRGVKWLVLLYINAIGLMTTFSRTGLLALAISLILAIIVLYKNDFKSEVKKIFILIMVLFFALVPFMPLVKQRVATTMSPTTDKALVERYAYIKISIEEIKNNILGTGLGTQTYKAYKENLYQKAGMSSYWLWQPVHNIYLITAVETGLIGLILFLLVLIKIFKNGFRKIGLGEINKEKKMEIIFSVTILFFILLFGMFDHFPITITPSNYLMWIAIGLLV